MCFDCPEKSPLWLDMRWPYCLFKALSLVPAAARAKPLGC